MKLYRNAIILVVVLGVLFGAYMLLKDRIPSGETDDRPEIIRLTDYSDDEVSTISVENKEGTFTIEKKDKEWVLLEPTDIKADSSSLTGIATNAESITADRLVEENPKDLSVYGLDKPVTVTVRLKAGGEKVVLLGNQTPTKSGYYGLDKAENKVYIIDTYTSEKLLFTKNKIRDTTLYTLSPEDIISLSMDRKGSNVFASKKMSESEWTIQKPIEGNANTIAINPMLQAITGATVKEFIEKNPSDLSKYGLDKPSYVFDFATSSQSYKLMLGTEKNKGTDIYAKLDGNDEVFTINLSAFTFLDKPFKEIIETFVYIVNIDKVNKIELEMDGRKTTFGIEVYKDEEGKNDNDKDKFTVDGKDASGKDENGKQPFRTFYQELIAISLDEVEPDANPTGNAEITITYYLKEAPGTMKVSFIPKDADKYYVMKNDKYTGIVVNKNKSQFGIKAMKESFKTLMDFLAKQN